MDGLTDFLEAVRAVFPHIRVQLSIVHMIRNSTLRRILCLNMIERR
ncbi:MAG: hypothetical protein LBB43_00155 [Spirochaetaceae bacterium]|nr:hypothetical protein [Spirochaetaceae bacterium]